MKIPGLPRAQGLYDPRFEKDGCGVGFVADVKGRKSRSIVKQALDLLENLDHRGARGSDGNTGDGAGVLVQIPHEFLVRRVASFGVRLPDAGEYGVGMFFLPQDPEQAHSLAERFEALARDEGLKILGWRDVPVHSEFIGAMARTTEPRIRQVFLGGGVGSAVQALGTGGLERKLYILRKKAEKELGAENEHFYPVSLSSRTLVYKGLLLPEQLRLYYPDLVETDFDSALALVHSRFSTNTFPAWRLAHPYRFLSHNGEINTVQGNVNWMRARQGRLHSEAFGVDLPKLFPIIAEGQSDSACLDNAVEFLVRGGRSLPHAMMMLIPEPWAGNPQMDLDRRGFYEYHAARMEPWDGPAAVCFTDGTLIGATLDRNGLRPCRFEVTDEDRVVMASEAGALRNDPSRIVRKGRLEPGKMFLIDTAQGRIIEDEEIKARISTKKPYREWVSQDRISLSDLPEPLNIPQPDHASLRQRQQVFGYTIEELKRVLSPMAVQGEEAISSMGNDTPPAVLSERPQLLFKYFRQMFAQVTNPPIDPIREQLVMSVATSVGPRPNLLEEGPGTCRRIRVPSPILTNADLEKIREVPDPRFKSRTLKILFKAEEGEKGLRAAVTRTCRQAALAVRQGVKFLILSDRGVDGEWAPIPSLLAVATVHHHLVRKSLRAEVGIIVESGEPRDSHHFACLIGYGAGAINPYLVFESLQDLVFEGYLPEGIDAPTAASKYIKAMDKGLLKILSKMGISTIQSYCGAQIFEALGIRKKVIERYFTGTPSRIEGVGLSEIAREVLLRHEAAYAPTPVRVLDPGGDIHYRVDGEYHRWNPATISTLQRATREGNPRTYREFSERVNDESRMRSTLRGLLEFVPSTTPARLEEVEPASEIVRRFTTGAMSLGALSHEAHEALAIAMNRLGAKSNSGEGGEDPARFETQKNSAIKQVASGRFGVTAHYLVSARELQIKMAQGAKPGEGGQLPGHKVDEEIARIRHSTPGVGLISPPPHHDIYSIEDLKQLIFDLKRANPAADVSVKLVSEAGVGTIAAGVAKAHADKVLISGDCGGTGASPLSSIQYAGMPWELGLAETHQALVLNGLRDWVRIETDGQLQTGRDVAIAALLGAEEFGFSTAPLIVEGCVMMRKCHLNTCPVGVATQDPELRKKFKGQPEHLINYFFFVAEELREIMAKLGLRRVSEMVGRVDRLKASSSAIHWKARGIDLSPLLFRATPAFSGLSRAKIALQARAESLDARILELCRPALENQKRVRHELRIQNTDRATGTLLSSQVAKRYGASGLPADTIQLRMVGSAGQSFGAFLSSGISLELEGESNDAVGKGLSGGRIVVIPPRESRFRASESILIGNVALFGATSGEAYFHGVAGERFAVRNSGARAVVEGTGDHGCEYMTGGAVVVLGPTGRNFAAGMSGGVAFVLVEPEEPEEKLGAEKLDTERQGATWNREIFAQRCNLGMVELEAIKSIEDAALLRKMLENHLKYTGSQKAQQVLANWDVSLPRFVKVMPVDYKLAMGLAGKRKSAARGGASHG